MPDATTTVQSLREAFGKFVAAREWDQFHNPKNLAMALSVEAAELLEHFLWVENNASRELLNDPRKREQVADEMADVAGCLLALSNSLGIDLSEAILHKLAKNEKKYPVERSRGRYQKPDALPPTGGTP